MSEKEKKPEQIAAEEKAMAIIDIVYNEQMVIHDYIVTDSTISVVADNDVNPCTNCQNTP